MSEAQEPRIQPLAQAQPDVQVQTQVQTHTSAQTQSQPQPVLALPATINKESSNSGHGNTLPALVSSNLPGASILERILSQPSQTPDKSDTHTQPSSRTHDQTRAHVNRPEEQLRAQEIVRSEDIDIVTNTQRSHGVTEAAGAREAENDLNIPAVDVIESTLKIFPSLPPISESIAKSTNITLSSTTVATDPTTTNSTSTSNLALSNGVPSEILQNTQHIGSTSLPKGSTPVMSNPPQHPGHARPPVGFPSPTYGPQGIYGYGNPPGPAGDIYRGHPGGHQPMSLPSMRTFDPVQQQQAQQAPMAQQMMQVQSSMPPYYGHPVPLAGNPYSLPPEAMNSRYALPPSDPRFLGNPRNKKEIKRRTKTGCLTCRKRRIKCDEQHPVCKNCQKSKRECLGYDPIFKQQQQHPSNIQPAPNSGGSHPAPATSVPSNGPPLPSPSSTAPSTTTTYGSLPSVLPSSYNSGASSSSNTPANAYEPSHSAPPSTVKSEHFEYGGPAIDPALDTVGAPSSTSTPHLPPVKSVAPILSPIAQRPPSTTLNLRGGGPHLPSYPSPQRAASYQHWTPAYSDYSVNKMRVDDLINWGRPPPSNPKVSPDQSKLDEIRGLYEEIYAPGLEGFFETKWYTEESTVNRLMFHNPLLEALAGFLNVVAKAEQNHHSTMTESADLEFRLVWDLACLALVTNEPRINPPSVITPENDAAEARNRVVVIEALLSGTVLEDNPLVRPPPTGDYHRVRELDFWYHVGEFCRVEPVGNPPNPDILSQRDQILSRIRMLLDGRENRDVLYSVAIMRALSPEYPSDFESTLPQHLDEDDPRCKLSVARKFVRDEAKVTGGTTNIVRRFSELAAMAFISPGVNVARRR